MLAQEDLESARRMYMDDLPYLLLGGLPLFLFLSIGSIALFSFIAVAAWSDARRREREAHYKSETIKKIAEAQGPGAQAALEFLREEAARQEQRQVNAALHRREGMKLGGLITIAVGIGLMIFLRAIVNGMPSSPPPGAPAHDPVPVYLVGLIPFLVGVALLAYTYLLAPKS